ncbi:MAG TPA: alpha-E domain-containing protein [Burkholderiales bacterium]|nr:alpha-E domain-containing protein [Burkholderiales bacterium]
MLSRTANDLYWMSRQIERAENTARMLDITYRMSLLPYRIMKPGEKWSEPWAGPLIINGLATAYYEHYDDLTAENVLQFMVLDRDNSSSIYSCMETARDNARAQRGAISTEMWESLNATWLEMRSHTYSSINRIGVSEFFEWVKDRSHLFRGVMVGTMLRDEAFAFSRVGTFLERADNTARILDVKYHTLLPSVTDVGGAVDYYQWSALLRSLSAFNAYRKIYRDTITPHRVAELLILRADVPRSLHACMNETYDILKELCDGESMEPERLAGELHAQLHYGKTEHVMEEGLHEYLMVFIDQIKALDSEINKYFLAPAYA